MINKKYIIVWFKRKRKEIVLVKSIKYVTPLY